MKRLGILLAIVCLATLCGTARATLINVDFGTDNDTQKYGNADSTAYTGAGLVGAAGDFWNSTSALSGTMTLKDAGNNDSGVTMTYSGGYMYCCGTALNDTSYKNLMNDYLISPTVTLTGVAAGKYDLYLYSSANATDRIAKFTATTSNGSAAVTIGPNTDYVATFKENVTYGVLQVQVGSNGQLNLTSESLGGEIDLNGFQLKSVPEPTAMVLVFSGVIGLLAYAWRKRK